MNIYSVQCTVYPLNNVVVVVDVVNKRGVREGRSFNSRRSSTDSSEDGAGLRDLRGELKELEDKFKKAMVANASLDNEKCQLMFQVHYSSR